MRRHWNKPQREILTSVNSWLFLAPSFPFNELTTSRHVISRVRLRWPKVYENKPKTTACKFLQAPRRHGCSTRKTRTSVRVEWRPWTRAQSSYKVLKPLSLGSNYSTKHKYFARPNNDKTPRRSWSQTRKSRVQLANIWERHFIQTRLQGRLVPATTRALGSVLGSNSTLNISSALLALVKLTRQTIQSQLKRASSAAKVTKRSVTSTKD